MVFKDIAMGLLFLFQTVLGTLGNSFLLGLYTITFLTGSRLRNIDLIVFHLVFVNDLMLFSKEILHLVAAFGLNNFLDDVRCKLVFYLHRVARDLSLFTTCLLSTFQAIIISPRNSKWIGLKYTSPKYIVQFNFYIWIFHLLKNSTILVNMKGPKESENITEVSDFIFCSATYNSIASYVLLFTLPDIACVGIMIWTSGYMLFTLYRHHQRVQYIHGNNVTPRGSLEKATQTILLLVCMFVSFYLMNSFSILVMHITNPPSWLVHISVFLASCFPACSPFVLILSDSQVSKYSLSLWGKVKPQTFSPDTVQLCSSLDSVPDLGSKKELSLNHKFDI